MQTLKLNNQKTHYSVAVVGGGQAGLSMSYYLQANNIDHIVIEKNTVMNAWKEKRWDSFTLVTPNWQCQLPGHPYDGDDPNGFMDRVEIIEYLNQFAQKVNPPIMLNTSVDRISNSNTGYTLETSSGTLKADQVVIASGSYPVPIIPRMAERIPSHIQQIHSEQYKNSEQLNDGAVLVVGSGQSGAQIAEDLHLSGRKVHLATGDSPRCARFYRGRDVVDWLDAMNYYEMPVHEHPLREGVRDNSNHYVTGRDGGRDIDLRQFASEGMELYGLMNDFVDDQFRFTPNLTANLNQADQSYNNINNKIDQYIAEQNIDAPNGDYYEPVWEPETEREYLSLSDSGITSIVWCIGFQPDFSWLDVPIFNGRGYPQHERGITKQEGLYFLGLPWLHTWGSARFSGVARDAEFVSEAIVSLSQSFASECRSA